LTLVKKPIYNPASLRTARPYRALRRKRESRGGAEFKAASAFWKF
jgi:hypothetical protein